MDLCFMWFEKPSDGFVWTLFCPLKQNVSLPPLYYLASSPSWFACLFYSYFYLQFPRCSLPWPFLFEILFLFYVFVCFISMNICTSSVRCTQKPEEGIKSLGTGAQDGCDPFCRCWELNSRSFGRAASALNLWAISPVQHWHFQWVFLLILKCFFTLSFCWLLLFSGSFP